MRHLYSSAGVWESKHFWCGIATTTAIAPLPHQLLTYLPSHERRCYIRTTSRRFVYVLIEPDNVRFVQSTRYQEIPFYWRNYGTGERGWLATFLGGIRLASTSGEIEKNGIGAYWHSSEFNWNGVGSPIPQPSLVHLYFCIVILLSLAIKHSWIQSKLLFFGKWKTLLKDVGCS